MNHVASAAAVCILVCVPALTSASHPRDFWETAVLRLFSVGSPATAEAAVDQKAVLLSTFVHNSSAHMQGFCFEVRSAPSNRGDANEKENLILQGVVAVQGVLSSVSSAGYAPEVNQSVFHMVLPRSQKPNEAATDDVVTVDLQIQFRPVGCLMALSALKPYQWGHPAAGGKSLSPAGLDTEELEETVAHVPVLPGNVTAMHELGLINAFYDHAAIETKHGKAFVSLNHIRIVKDDEGIAETQPWEAPRRGLGTSGSLPEEDQHASDPASSVNRGLLSPATIFTQSTFMPGWNDDTTAKARPQLENGVNGEWKAHCKYLPLNSKISISWIPEEDNVKASSSPFLGKKSLEFWINTKSVEEPEPLLVNLTSEAGSCRQVSTSDTEPEERLGEWTKVAINLSRFDALEQTHEGAMLFSCNDHTKVTDIKSITWTLPSSLMGSTVCLDDIKLI